jgi:hypothetical protein
VKEPPRLLEADGYRARPCLVSFQRLGETLRELRAIARRS